MRPLPSRPVHRDEQTGEVGVFFDRPGRYLQRVEAFALPLVAIGGAVDGFVSTLRDNSGIDSGLLLQLAASLVEEERPWLVAHRRSPPDRGVI